MRFMIKLLLMVALGVAAQALIERHEQEIDDAQFAARCFLGKLCGRDNVDEELMDAAVELRSRELERIQRRWAAAAACATTRPAEVGTASIADELEWSLACSTAREAR